MKQVLVLLTVISSQVLAVPTNYSGHYTCQGTLTCFQLQLLRNLSDISTSEDIVLAGDLVLEKVPGVRVTEREDLTPGGVERRLTMGADKDITYLGSVLAKKALQLLESHNLRWRVMRGVDVTVFRNAEHQVDLGIETYKTHPDGRTFGIGARKRLMMALLPMMYKMGVMTTMLGGLIVLTLKGLTIGVILLVLAVANILTKLKYDHGGHHGGWGHYQGPPIHVHVHTDGHKQAYSAWHPSGVGSGPGIPVEYHHDR